MLCIDSCSLKQLYYSDAKWGYIGNYNWFWVLVIGYLLILEWKDLKKRFLKLNNIYVKADDFKKTSSRSTLK